MLKYRIPQIVTLTRFSYLIKFVFVKKKILNNLLTIKDFFWVTEGTRTLDIQNHNLTL